MIAEFLRQEYANHDRYGARIDECLHLEGVAARRITDADQTDPVANAERRSVFARYRGYGAGGYSYLTDFPATGVAWNWVALTPDELLDSQYIRYTPWSNLSQGTRSPRVAAERIRTGLDIPGHNFQVFLALADELRAGLVVPPLFLVSADDGETRVILEGHTRITAWALAPEAIPSEVAVILGVSPDIARWDEY